MKTWFHRMLAEATALWSDMRTMAPPKRRRTLSKSERQLRRRLRRIAAPSRSRNRRAPGKPRLTRAARSRRSARRAA